MIRLRPAMAMLVVAVPAAAQDHGMHGMAGMTMPMPAAKPQLKPKPKPRAPSRAAARKPTPRAMPTPTPMPAMESMPAMDHAAMGHAVPLPTAAAPNAIGTDLPAGDAPAPPAPMPHYADRIWDPAAMARGRAIMMRDEGGGRSFAQALADIAEYRVGGGYRWDGQAWIGGDIDRLVLKSEGDGDARLDRAEVRALYSHAIGPYFDLQGGVRQDIRPAAGRSYATIGIAGLAPYWFEVEAAAFVSTHGEVLGRVEASYDQRVTQRLVLQPRAELNLSAQTARRIALGSGITSVDLGLRLRYEIRRAFAPYLGVTWERSLGGSARLARAAGRDPGGPALVVGIRGWF